MADHPAPKQGMRQAAATALVGIIDGQISTRRAEIESLLRLRRIVVEEHQMHGG